MKYIAIIGDIVNFKNMIDSSQTQKMEFHSKYNKCSI